jgi:hypothetical protein
MGIAGVVAGSSPTRNCRLCGALRKAEQRTPEPTPWVENYSAPWTIRGAPFSRPAQARVLFELL